MEARCAEEAPAAVDLAGGGRRSRSSVTGGSAGQSCGPRFEGHGDSSSGRSSDRSS